MNFSNIWKSFFLSFFLWDFFLFSPLFLFDFFSLFVSLYFFLSFLFFLSFYLVCLSFFLSVFVFQSFCLSVSLSHCLLVCLSFFFFLVCPFSCFFLSIIFFNRSAVVFLLWIELDLEEYPILNAVSTHLEKNIFHRKAYD